MIGTSMDTGEYLEQVEVFRRRIKKAICAIVPDECCGVKETLEFMIGHRTYYENSFLMSIMADVAAGSTYIASRDTYQVPATWWQHVKRDALPKFVQRRWPVRYDTLDAVIEFVNVCPHATIPWGQSDTGDRAHIEFLTTRPKKAKP